MTSEQLTQKMTVLREEMQKAEEELAKLRPRVQYLEAMQHRLDGALAVLQELQATPDTSNHVAAQGD